MLNNRAGSATGVYFDDKRIHVRLSDGREISAPLEWFPRLSHATNEQRQHWELIGRGVGIHWEEIDEDISVAGLLGLSHD
jgi:hypothetical protein